MTSVSSKKWDASAFIVGVLSSLSFAPFDYSFLFIAGLLFLNTLTIDLSPTRSFLRGLLFGLGQFGFGVSWVYISIHEFGGANLVFATLLTAMFVFFWSIFPGLAVLSFNVIHSRVLIGRIFLFPLVWILFEYIRGNLVLNGFPWLQLAYSQMDTSLSGYAPVFGSYGVGFLTALTASLISYGYLQRKMSYKPLLYICMIWGLGFILKSMNWTQDIGSPLKVALIQGNVAQDQKWKPEFRLTTLQKYQDLTQKHWQSDVIVWPETAVPAYLDEVNDSYIEPLGNAAKRHNSSLIISVPVRDHIKNEKYNAVIVLGKQKGIYKKVHLLPFGEYMPWQPFSGLILKHLKVRLGLFTPGSLYQPLLKAGEYEFATTICYEDVFSERALPAMPKGAFLVNVTNDGWFGKSIEPYQHMQMARMRALETGRYLLRATNTGLTGIVAPNGNIVEQAPMFSTTSLSGSIMPKTGMTPFSYIGDRLIVLSLAMTLFLLVIGNSQYFKKTEYL